MVVPFLLAALTNAFAAFAVAYVGWWPIAIMHSAASCLFFIIVRDNVRAGK